jgi:RNA-dependent RNA polymerase
VSIITLCSFSKTINKPPKFRFTHELDSVKTRLKVKPEVFSADKRKWTRPRPDCMPQTVEQAARVDKSNQLIPSGHQNNILDYLFAYAKQVQTETLGRFHEYEPHRENAWDADLMHPYQEASQLTRLKAVLPDIDEDLKMIKKHVRELFSEFLRIAKPPSEGGHSPVKVNRSARNAQFTAITHKFSQPIQGLRVLNQRPFDEDEIKASYAVKLLQDERKRNRFPFSVAFAALCRIKARAIIAREQAESRNPLTVLPSIASAMTLPSSIVRGVKAQYELNPDG